MACLIPRTDQIALSESTPVTTENVQPLPGVLQLIHAVRKRLIYTAHRPLARLLTKPVQSAQALNHGRNRRLLGVKIVGAQIETHFGHLGRCEPAWTALEGIDCASVYPHPVAVPESRVIEKALSLPRLDCPAYCVPEKEHLVARAAFSGEFVPGKALQFARTLDDFQPRTNFFESF